MARTGVRFGTSGARGRVEAMTDLVGYAYTQGFLRYLRSTGELGHGPTRVAVAGDLRPSTDRIMEAVFRGIEDLGHVLVPCGKIPSPALALYGLEQRIPSIMVTGSHIPADRNGIKFNKCAGEVLKEDEAGIAAQQVEISEDRFDGTGSFRRRQESHRQIVSEAQDQYMQRYLRCLGPHALQGYRIGVYQHSAVGRHILLEVLHRAGAECTPLGLATEFVPVDTEAIRVEDARLAAGWAAQHRFDAIVSTDGDSDRPLLSNEFGECLRGDVAGILCARFLGADSVSTPVSSNTAVERCGWFREVRRTRIGSPYVVASMLEASDRGARCVAGYEANGGFLLNSEAAFGCGTLRALPTRDALILLLSILLLARREGRTISQLTAQLPQRFTASGLLRDCSPIASQAILNRFSRGDEPTDRQALEAVFGPAFGRIRQVDRTDGIRMTFESSEIVHLRPSGNAPEFRCYNESASPGGAQAANALCLRLIRDVMGAEAAAP
jgi:phosphomannomutase